MNKLIKACSQSLGLVFVVSPPWSGAQSSNGCFSFARAFAANLNILNRAGFAGG